MLRCEVAPDDRRGIVITGSLHTWTTVGGRRVHWAGKQWLRSPEEAEPECRNEEEVTHRNIRLDIAT